MSDGQGKNSAVMTRVHKTVSRWFGSIGFRVSFLMTVALTLAALLVGALFFWEGKGALDTEARSRALNVARELAARTTDDIITQNRSAIKKTLTTYFTANKNDLSGNVLLYLLAYDPNCRLLVGNNGLEVFYKNPFSYTLPSESSTVRDETSVRCDSLQGHAPVFFVKKNGVYDLTLPVMVVNEYQGLIRVGILGKKQYQNDFLKKAGVALLGILLVGLAFSQIIARGITRPILQLNEAAEKISYQNWDTQLFTKGSDEISTLSRTFNQMALALKQREVSLSHGNRDLLILHTAGLDLMESLDRNALLAKIAARTEDMVRADTTAISVVDRSDHMLKYLGVFGNVAPSITARELPIEAGGIYNWLASYGTPLLIPDAQADFRLDNVLMKALGIKSIIVAPLWSSGAMAGLLTAINKKRGAIFDKHDLRLFTVFASLAAAALQNASLYSNLKEKINELKDAQEQLIQSTKMAAIGELSANVAHEVNNPLTSVLGYTTYLQTLHLSDEPNRILGMMEQETLRVRKIIRNLLDFARHTPSRMQPVDISLPLQEVVALVQGIADASSITIRENYPAEPIIANIDHNQMKQVFINIIHNALQAMPKGGTIEIRLYRYNDNELVVEISDTGQGIPPENMGKIFEPFFSTKKNGDGTGLGLSISYRIVRNHGGRIEVKSTVGEGSLFRVIMPA